MCHIWTIKYRISLQPHVMHLSHLHFPVYNSWPLHQLRFLQRVTTSPVGHPLFKSPFTTNLWSLSLVSIFITLSFHLLTMRHGYRFNHAIFFNAWDFARDKSKTSQTKELTRSHFSLKYGYIIFCNKTSFLKKMTWISPPGFRCLFLFIGNTFEVNQFTSFLVSYL